MFDNDNPIPFDNLRGLLQDLATVLDDHFSNLRQGTRYESIRKSDTKVFILASRDPRSMAALAKDLAISRQAVHDCVKRLIDLEIVELVAHPNNSRDKIVAVTERGLKARMVALGQIQILEAHCAELLGKEEFELFRKMLVTLLHGLKQKPPEAFQATGVKSSSS
jgi:DNA-binding MarR family transcriptional regulator